MARAQRAAAAVQAGVQGRKLMIFVQQELKAEGVKLDSPASLWVQQQVRLAQDAGASGPELALFVQQCVQFAAQAPGGRPEKAPRPPAPKRPKAK